jgi:hypothetical protein
VQAAGSHLETVTFDRHNHIPIIHGPFTSIHKTAATGAVRASSAFFCGLQVNCANQLPDLAAGALGAFRPRLAIVLHKGLFDGEMLATFFTLKLIVSHFLSSCRTSYFRSRQ